MPELPEVETIRKVLDHVIVGSHIKQINYHKKRIFRNQAPSLIKNKLLNQKILAVGRRAKFLLVKLSKGTLLIHLGMSGQVIVQERKKEHVSFTPDKHTHFTLTLSNAKYLYYRDPRMFGRINYYDTQEKLDHQFYKYGPEPLTAEFNSNYFMKAVAGKHASIKSLLLNQVVAPGMGNIYTDEALFIAKIDPVRPGLTITDHDASQLVKAVKQVLRAGIKAKGTSISDYRDPYQNQGQFQMRLKVYGRDGETCISCGTTIQKDIIAQRGTHWCPSCQH